MCGQFWVRLRVEVSHMFQVRVRHQCDIMLIYKLALKDTLGTALRVQLKSWISWLDFADQRSKWRSLWCHILGIQLCNRAILLHLFYLLFIWRTFSEKLPLLLQHNVTYTDISLPSWTSLDWVHILSAFALRIIVSVLSGKITVSYSISGEAMVSVDTAKHPELYVPQSRQLEEQTLHI